MMLLTAGCTAVYSELPPLVNVALSVNVIAAVVSCMHAPSV